MPIFCKRNFFNYKFKYFSTVLNQNINLTQLFIRDKIRSGGPITVHELMQLCVSSPAGYYNQRLKESEIFGDKGDFVTSPELTQIFGELIGVWIINELQNCGWTGEWQLVELGPGRGFLTKDIISVLKRFSIKNVSLNLIEKSEELIYIQKELLCLNQDENVTKENIPIQWYREIEELPEKFTVFIANEFFDALPIHQFERAVNNENKWREVYVNLDKNQEKFCFMLSKSENLHTRGLIFDSIREDKTRYQWEVSPISADYFGKMVYRFTQHGGFSLIFDYGHDGTRREKSLRAYQNHQLVDPLISLGHSDLTADVDFSYIKQILTDKSLIFGPVNQRNFLVEMGLNYRLEYLLKQCKTKEERIALQKSTQLLIGDDNGMGKAFKAFSLFPKTLNNIMKLRGGAPNGFKSLLKS